MKTKNQNSTVTSIRRRKSRLINVQRHKASCGPIAVANFIKWSGIETSYSMVLNFCRGIKAYHPKVGMWPYQMTYVLKTLKVPFKKHRKFTFKDLEIAIRDGGSLILVYDSKDGSHAAFIDAMTETQLRVWNRQQKSGPWVDKDFIREVIRKSRRRPGHLYAFVFTKSSE